MSSRNTRHRRLVALEARLNAADNVAHDAARWAWASEHAQRLVAAGLGQATWAELAAWEAENPSPGPEPSETAAEREADMAEIEQELLALRRRKEDNLKTLKEAFYG